MKFECAHCRAVISPAMIELDAEFRIVCGECYLMAPPQADIDGALHDIYAATSTVIVED